MFLPRAGLVLCTLLWHHDEEEDTCVSYEEEDTCVSYEEEDTCVSYAEEDTCFCRALVLCCAHCCGARTKLN
jgi:hypothetical protein